MPIPIIVRFWHIRPVSEVRAGLHGIETAGNGIEIQKPIPLAPDIIAGEFGIGQGREYGYVEPRGVGGVFFDDLCVANTPEGFEKSFAIMQSIGDAFLPAYRDIILRRRDTPWGERERDWQCLRRGRYVEFNLVFDRGTLFGLQSGGRTESILMSMPPLVKWRYDYQPEAGSPEAQLLSDFLIHKDWV